MVLCFGLALYAAHEECWVAFGVWVACMAIWGASAVLEE